MKAYFHILCCLIVWIGPATAGLSAQSGWLAHPELRAAYDSLVQLAETYPDDSIARKSWLLHQSGLRASGSREFTDAIGVTQRALDLRMSQEDNFEIEVVLSAFNLGTYYNMREEYQEALDHFGMVLNRAPHRKEGVAHYQCGIVYGKMGELVASGQAFSRAAELPPFKEEGINRAYLWQQMALVELSKLSVAGGLAAIPKFQRALEYFVREEYWYSEMETRSLLGWAYTEAGQYENAIKELTSARELALELEIDDTDLSTIYSNLGLAYRRSGRPKEALAQYEKALEVEATYDDPGVPNISIATYFDNIATVYLEAGQPDSALLYTQRALARTVSGFTPADSDELPLLNDMTGSRQSLVTFLQDKALAQVAMARNGATENLESSLATYRLADELLDLMRQDQLLEDTRTFWRADARTLYERAIDAAVAAGDPVSAFYFLEKARARLLLDELSADRAGENLPEFVRDRLDAAARQTRLSSNDPVELQQFRRLQDSIFTAFPRYAEARLGAAPPDPARLAEILGADRTLVEYFVTEKLTLALRWSQKQGLEFLELPPPDRWRDRLQAYRQSLVDPNEEVSATEALYLYSQLVAPLKLEPGDALTIVPDGDLYLLPFGALLTDAPATDEAGYQHWPWLAATHDVHYAFSVQLLDFARNRRGRGNGRALALAPVARLRQDGPLDPKLELPATLRTVRHIASLFPADTLINDQASPGAFRRKADAYSLIHLGTHAYLDQGGSFLLHGQPGEQHYAMNNLADHNLQADLVVMGACETGLGKQLVGEGVASLGRGFARRGAPALVMSLWSIDDATTAELLNATYDGLAAASGPAAALYTAGNSYRTNVTNPRFGHPYYWAGLVYYGPEMPLEMGATGSYLRLWLLAGFGLVIGCWWVTRGVLKAL
ncbi:CHAT domain-containing protein [Neolewinella persica]|uniref:CHAT domain-containing protein n=1 Tax=Neolewinella persica TaxID=70998 RepID=UPI00035E4FCD|nr:CHAT domain-containing tetratricopeptide repeat protein [Neolewinella persica]